MHEINERMQSFRPHIGVHPPIAEAGMVVTAQMEPTVVEHVSLHPDSGGTTGNLQ